MPGASSRCGEWGIDLKPEPNGTGNDRAGSARANGGYKAADACAGNGIRRAVRGSRWNLLRRSISRDAMHMKWKVFGWLAAFVGLLLVLLWIFQTVLLDDFYQGIKAMAVRNVATDVQRNLDIADFDTYLDSVAESKDMSILVANTDGSVIKYSSNGQDSHFQRFTLDELAGLYVKTAGADGEWSTYIDPQMQIPPNGSGNAPTPGGSGNSDGSGAQGVDSGTSNGTDDGDDGIKTGNATDDKSKSAGGKSASAIGGFNAGGFLPDMQHQPPSRENKRGLLLAKTSVTADGTPVLVAVYAFVVPVDSTIETLRLQLLVISVIFLLLSSVMALILSRRLSTPIVSISESAKQLATGDFDIRFEGKGYREVSELSDTLNYAARELSKVEGLRRELIANISHDLRTPLTMITGYAEVMRDLPGENSPENVQVIIEESKRLNTLVSDILDLSRLQSGVQEVAIRPCSLTQVVRSIMQRCQKFMEQDGYVITFEADSEVCVDADETRLTQVVYNLVQNAMAYTGPDKTVRVIQRAENGRVRIIVQDSGPGIPADQLPYIWDRYYKGDKAHRRSTVGTGLGLSIVKAVLERHGAEYGVDSSPKGSRFWFSLPCRDSLPVD